jgi:hypothetical protein
VLKLCQAVMRQKKTSEPPFSPRYFSREVNKQVEALRRPLPVLHGRRWRYVWPKPAVGAA